MNYASSRLTPVKPSASAAVSQLAKSLVAAGEDVIDLGLGEPDFQTPKHIIEAAHQAALSGQTKYPPTDGTAELKDAIVGKLKRENQLDYSQAEVFVSNGAKQVIFAAFMATLEPEQEVLLCAPFFDSYKNICLVLGAQPKFLACKASNKFKLTPAVLEAAITPKTRWVLLNAPSNPAGAVYSTEELQALGEVLARHPHVLLMSDEIYEHILFDGANFVSFAASCPQLRDQTLVVNGVSKAYAMTGWRIGYCAGPQKLIAAMTKVQSQISSGACSIAQAAAAAALNGPQDEVRRFRAACEQRRNLIVQRVAAIPGLTLDPPAGAFYALIGCEALMGSRTPAGERIPDDNAFCQYLLNQGKVATVPGSTYGLSPFFRITTAASEEQLKRAMDRIEQCVTALVST